MKVLDFYAKSCVAVVVGEKAQGKKKQQANEGSGVVVVFFTF